MSELEDEIEAEYLECVEEAQAIDRQLSQRRPIGKIDNGEYAEYREWRRRAVRAKEGFTARARELKAELKSTRREAAALAVEHLRETESPEQIIKDLLTICVAHQAYLVPEHQRAMDRAKLYLGQTTGRTAEELHR